MSLHKVECVITSRDDGTAAAAAQENVNAVLFDPGVSTSLELSV